MLPRTDRSPVVLLSALAFAVFSLVPELGSVGSSGEALGDAMLAYLDPAIGSVVIQAAIAAVAAVAVGGRLYWAKIKSFFGLAPPEDEAVDDE